METKKETKADVTSTPASPDYKALLAAAPTLHEVLARPSLYEAWLKKLQEAANG